ncbi:c-type cytochrome biogenesis protein CcmI [Microbulbifer sp. TYP-18]|uniref:c-type cytochrome biogenesis protein CcmI n=1 Tax=Microbulbifer sp. TYP-18 TaxID=3230024 RepID=UPI0034C63D38
MLGLWFGLLLLALLLVAVLLWPTLRRKDGEAAGTDAGESQRSALAALYRERRAEWRAARDRGAMEESQLAQLEADAARDLLAAEGNPVGGHTSSGGRWLLLALAILLPVLALGFYSQSDRYGELTLYRDLVASTNAGADAEVQGRITAALEQRAGTHPEDLTSRYVLAQRLLAQGDLAGAVASYRYVVAREPQAAGVKAELAQALFFAGGSRITEEVSHLVGEVLAVEPDNGTALGLAGIAAFERREFRAARDYWRRAQKLLAPESAAAQALAAGVARAEAELSPGKGVAGTVTAGGDNASISVHVSLAEGIVAAPETPVFVYARGADSPMPLAIVRLRADQLPAQVVLDESRAMMPGRSLEGAGSVQLVARLALHGDARAAPGDWQGGVESLDRAEWGKPVSITIDREL